MVEGYIVIAFSFKKTQEHHLPDPSCCTALLTKMPRRDMTKSDSSRIQSSQVKPTTTLTSNFCMVVRTDMALAEVEEHEDEEDEEEQLLDVRKRIKIDKLVLLYALVLHTNSWYNIWVEDGVADI